MTGAKDLVGAEYGLMFSLPRTRHFVKEGINKVRITLDASDTYTMEYYKAGRINCPLLQSDTGVYAEDLQRFFTAATGLSTHL
jgi:hypothetical protein